METTDRPDRLDRLIPWAMVLTILAVAAFAFVQSYTHVYYLGQTHHQNGASLRMLPLSVDWLMFAAGLTRLHLLRKGLRHKLPLSGLALGAIATLVANVASGFIWGWETAAIQAWAPIVLFVVVELGMLLVRTAKAKAEPSMVEIPTGVARRLEEEERRSNTNGPQPTGIIKFDGEVSPEQLAEADRLVSMMQGQTTQLSQPQPAPDPSPDTATIPKAVDDSPEQSLSGWGQLGQPGEPAGQASQLGRQEPTGGLTGIGLANGKRK